MLKRWKLAMRTSWAIIMCPRQPKALVMFEDTASIIFGGFGWRYDPGDIELPQAKLGAAFATLLFRESTGEERAAKLVSDILTLFKEQNVSPLPDFSRGRGVVYSDSLH